MLGDGGMVFELERRGYVSAGYFTPEAVIECPEAVKQLHTDFARAGAEVLQAFTYYAYENKLKQRGLDGALGEINTGAISIARSVADEYGALVAGNLSNTWVYDPHDRSSDLPTRRQMEEQLEIQMQNPPDFFVAETIEYLGEALIALEAIKSFGTTAMITLGFKASDRTLDGFSLEEAFSRLEAKGADIVGINCFRDPPRMLPLLKRVRETVGCFVASQPVAYRCSDEAPYFEAIRYQDRFAFPLELDPFVLTRYEMADYALQAKDIGINYIGGCCGTAPHHLRAMAEALGREVPNSRYSPAAAFYPS